MKTCLLAAVKRFNVCTCINQVGLDDDYILTYLNRLVFQSLISMICPQGIEKCDVSVHVVAPHLLRVHVIMSEDS